MNWDALGALGETVGAIAVVVTLLFLILQLKQNTKALAFQNSRSSLTASTAITSATLDPEIASVLTKAYTDEGELSPYELQILDSYVYGMMAILHQDYIEYSEGLHSERWWKRREHGVRRLLWSETPRKVWAIYTDEDFDEEFMRMVREALSTHKPRSYYQDVL